MNESSWASSYEVVENKNDLPMSLAAAISSPLLLSCLEEVTGLTDNIILQSSLLFATSDTFTRDKSLDFLAVTSWSHQSLKKFCHSLKFQFLKGNFSFTFLWIFNSQTEQIFSGPKPNPTRDVQRESSCLLITTPWNIAETFCSFALCFFAVLAVACEAKRFNCSDFCSYFWFDHCYDSHSPKFFSSTSPLAGVFPRQHWSQSVTHVRTLRFNETTPRPFLRFPWVSAYERDNGGSFRSRRLQVE